MRLLGKELGRQIGDLGRFKQFRKTKQKKKDGGSR
jgi:hypothetical protein